MITPIETQTEVDPFDSANNPTEAPSPKYYLWGKWEISAWNCALIPGQGKVAYDPAAHKQRYTAIDAYVQPLIELDIKYPKSLECHWISEFAEWRTISLPSIKAQGHADIRETNGLWVCVDRVPTGKTYDKKDKATGQLTGEKGKETTFAVVKFFKTEEECRADYLANGGTPADANGNGHNTPAPIADTERIQARNIMTVVIGNVMPGKTKFADVQEAIKAHAFYPHVEKYYPVDSIETMALITEITKLLPF